MSLSRKHSATASAVAILFFVLILAYAFTAPALANTVTFSDYGLTNQKVLVYNSSSLVGEFNSNESVTLNPAENYVIVFKPAMSADFLSNPAGFVEMLQIYMPTLLEIGVLLLIVLGFGLIIKKVLD